MAHPRSVRACNVTENAARTCGSRSGSASKMWRGIPSRTPLTDAARRAGSGRRKPCVARIAGSSVIMACSIRAQSATLRAIGPTQSMRPRQGQHAAARETSACVGTTPATPHQAAGTRIDPAVSVPDAPAHCPPPPQLPTADEEDEASQSQVPGVARRRERARPATVPPTAYSAVAACRGSPPPPAAGQSTTGGILPCASVAAMRAPAVVGRPATSIRSLIPMGRPCSGPSTPTCRAVGHRPRGLLQRRLGGNGDRRRADSPVAGFDAVKIAPRSARAAVISPPARSRACSVIGTAGIVAHAASACCSSAARNRSQIVPKLVLVLQPDGQAQDKIRHRPSGGRAVGTNRHRGHKAARAPPGGADGETDAARPGAGQPRAATAGGKVSEKTPLAPRKSARNSALPGSPGSARVQHAGDQRMLPPAVRQSAAPPRHCGAGAAPAFRTRAAPSEASSDDTPIPIRPMNPLIGRRQSRIADRDRPHDHIGMARDVFRQRLGHDIRAQRQGLQVQGRGPGVVHPDERPRRMGDLGDRAGRSITSIVVEPGLSHQTIRVPGVRRRCTSSGSVGSKKSTVTPKPAPDRPAQSRASADRRCPPSST